VDDCAEALRTTPSGSGIQPLLLGGTHALWTDGDRQASRDWFDAAYRMAEATDDTEAMALAALGLGGLWLDEYRHTAAAVLADARLRRVAAAVDPRSAFGLRLKIRLAGEADHRKGAHAAIVAAVKEAGRADDAVALAEAAAMAHQCLLGPGHAEARHTLARDLIAASFQTGRRSDLLTGLLWQTVDLFTDADPHAERHLADLKAPLAQDKHPAVGFVVSAIGVMLSIRAGHLEQAGTLADAALRNGSATGDANAVGWHGLHLLAIRWYQGRAAEHLPALRELANSPTLSATDNSLIAGLALAGAASGDHRTATHALARLHGADPAHIPQSATWLLALHGVVEAASLLDDGAAAGAAADLLHPFAHLPIVVGPGRLFRFGPARPRRRRTDHRRRRPGGDAAARGGPRQPRTRALARRRAVPRAARAGTGHAGQHR
jgi:hypothetical protein